MTEQELIKKLQEIGLETAKLKAENECLRKENFKLWNLVDRFMDAGDVQ